MYNQGGFGGQGYPNNQGYDYSGQGFNQPGYGGPMGGQFNQGYSQVSNFGGFTIPDKFTMT